MTERIRVGDLQVEVIELKEDASRWKNEAARLGNELSQTDDMATTLKTSLIQAEDVMSTSLSTDSDAYPVFL